MAKTMGVGPLTGNIYYGETKNNKFVGKKEDVTNMAIKAVFEWFMNKLRDAGEDDNTFELRFPGVPYVLEMRKEEKGETRAKTNADRIREMSDDELYDFITRALFCGGLIERETTSEMCGGCEFPFCTGGFARTKDWLKEEVADNE